MQLGYAQQYLAFFVKTLEAMLKPPGNRLLDTTRAYRCGQYRISVLSASQILCAGASHGFQRPYTVEIYI